MVSEVDEDGNEEIDFEGERHTDTRAYLWVHMRTRLSPATRLAGDTRAPLASTHAYRRALLTHTPYPYVRCVAEFAVVMSRRVVTQHTPDEVKRAFEVGQGCGSHGRDDASGPDTLTHSPPPPVHYPSPRTCQTFRGDAPAGKIHVDSIVRALTTFSTRKVTPEAARELTLVLEPDANGWVGFEEFIDAMS